MKLKNKYIVLIIITHLLFAVITSVIYKYNKAIFICAELLIFISIIIFLKFYKSVFQPLKIIQAGIESISDKDFSMKMKPLGDKELDKLIEVYNKMIDQLRMERIKTSEKNFFLEKLIEASPAAIIIMDKNGLISTYNSAAATFLNITESKHQNISELPEPWNIELEQIEESGNSIIQIDGISQFKCYKSYFIDKGVKQNFFIIEELTHELLKAERLSYEKIIRMMSHEVNNSVGSVNSIIDSTLLYLSQQSHDNKQEYINVLSIARERISNLNLFTKRFADIVHIPDPILSECDLEECIGKMLILFKKELQEKNILVEANFQGNPNISFDYQQLELVTSNILKNAIQAINKEGKIRILYDGNAKILTIENNGEPISLLIQKRVFEPFFTTKKTGQGIGLTLIREILTNHSCNFSLKTRKDNITEFKISFNA